MPKGKRDRSVPFVRPKKSLGTESNLKEWEEARCAVCIEHPHNAVLLLCSSHEKGCRPYMCNTSYRHSNCLDQYRKSSEALVADLQGDSKEETSCEKPKLVCPLCRGEVNEWIIVKPARHFMNTKSRSCACENCDFSGNYRDLRKHARLEHPLLRPSEADPERERDWRRMEQQRDLGDLFSTLQSSYQEEGGEDTFTQTADSLLTVFFLTRVLRPRFNRLRARTQESSRRRSSGLRGESYDGENGSSSSRDDEDDETSDGGSGRRVRQRTTPESEPRT